MKAALMTLILGVIHQSIAFADDPMSLSWQRLIDSSEIIAEARSIRTEVLPGSPRTTCRTHFRIKEVFKGTNIQELAVDWFPITSIYNVTLGDVGADYMLFLSREFTNAVGGKQTDGWVLRKHRFMRQVNLNGQRVVDWRSLMLVHDVPPEINLSTKAQPYIKWNSLVKWLRANVKSKYHPDQSKPSAFLWVAIGIGAVVFGCILAALVRRRKPALPTA